MEILSTRVKNLHVSQKLATSLSKTIPTGKIKLLAQKSIIINESVANAKTTKESVPEGRGKATMQEDNEILTSSPSSSPLHKRLDLTKFPSPPFEYIDFTSTADERVLKAFGGSGSAARTDG